MNKLKPLRRFGPYRTYVWLSDAQARERVITNALRRVLTSCECEDCSERDLST
jgi:hypothetical protein